MTRPESLVGTLSCDEALTVALVVLDIFCGDGFLAMTPEQRRGAILMVDAILSVHVVPVLDADGASEPLIDRLGELHAVADRIRRFCGERVH